MMQNREIKSCENDKQKSTAMRLCREKGGEKAGAGGGGGDQNTASVT